MVSVDVDFLNKSISKTNNGNEFTLKEFDKKLSFSAEKLSLSGTLGIDLNGFFQYVCTWTDAYNRVCSDYYDHLLFQSFTIKCGSNELSGRLYSDSNSFSIGGKNLKPEDQAKEFHLISQTNYTISKLYVELDNIEMFNSLGTNKCEGQIKISGSISLAEYSKNIDSKGNRSLTGNYKEIIVNTPLQLKLNFLPYISAGNSTYATTLKQNNSSGDYSATVNVAYVTNANNVIVKLKSCDSDQGRCTLKDSDAKNRIPLTLKINDQELKPQTDQNQSIAIRASNELNVDLLAAAAAVKQAKPGTYKNKTVLVLTADFQEG